MPGHRGDRDEKPVNAVCHNITTTWRIIRDQRGRAVGGFDQAFRQPLAIARQHNDVRTGQQRRQVLDMTEPIDEAGCLPVAQHRFWNRCRITGVWRSSELETQRAAPCNLSICAASTNSRTPLSQSMRAAKTDTKRSAALALVLAVV